MLVNIYGVMIPKPHEGEDENRPPTPHELLGAYACKSRNCVEFEIINEPVKLSYQLCYY